jgi:hypothetical protein
MHKEHSYCNTTAEARIRTQTMMVYLQLVCNHKGGLLH